VQAGRVVITGGAGFIGSNTAAHYLARGADVTILDNFSRRGSKSNAAWLESLRHEGSLKIVHADVRHDLDSLARTVDAVDIVLPRRAGGGDDVGGESA